MNDLDDSPAASGPPPDILGALLYRLSQLFAMIGGITLLGVIALSVVSIVGRRAFSTPVSGDIELVQLGCAVAVASFLPYCQMRRGHVIVDIFTSRLSKRSRDALDALGGLLLCVSAALLAWRLSVGTASALENEETTMILGVPVWWGYAPLAVSFLLLSAVALYCVWSDLRSAARA